MGIVLIQVSFSEQINGLFRGGTATVMRETVGNMLFFTTYETTRYHLFKSFGLDPNRGKTSSTDEPVSTQSMVADTLLETGIGIITGGLSGVAVSTSLNTEFSHLFCMR